MPRVKVDYVVSFSSEHPEHPASNLVASEVSKKRWLCHPGESSCSVVLQLARAVQISSVNIGAYNTAFIEVLVGRSEGSGEQFQVLVARSVLQTPSEARRAAAGTAVERVRAFSGDQLAPAAAQRWDRLRLVCSQPYNKHCQYGLSFVHVYEPEVAGPPSAPPALDTYSSSEDEFHPGELFATHQKGASHTDTTPAAAAPINTETQIRQATSQALKNVCESSTKLKKTPIAKAEVRRATVTPEASPRARPSLTHRRSDTNDTRTTRHEQSDRKDKRRKSEERESNTGRDERDAKRQRLAGDGWGGGRDKETGGRVLSGVVVSLSGYVNPRRAALRALAVRLGARCEPHWTPACTHLICAFPRTPKLQQAAEGGRAVRAARGEWLQAVARAGRRHQLQPPAHWDRPASDPRHQLQPPAHWDRPASDPRHQLQPPAHWDRPASDPRHQLQPPAHWDRPASDPRHQLQPPAHWDRPASDPRHQLQPPAHWDRPASDPRHQLQPPAHWDRPASDPRHQLQPPAHWDRPASDPRHQLQPPAHWDRPASDPRHQLQPPAHWDRPASDPRHQLQPPAHWDRPASDPRHQLQPPAHWDRPASDITPPQPSDCDTDDEIEEVLRKQKQREVGSPVRTASDVASEAPEDSDSADTLEGDVPPRPPRGPGLPALFEGRTFVVGAAGDKALLTRYIRAYGGLVLQESEGEPADYWVGPGGPGAAAHVSPAWLWRCHRDGRLLPPD